MPTNKDFKRLVRRRMQKTGESYTAARAQLLKRAKADTTPRVDYARLSGIMSDAALKAQTGCTWERWVRALDRVQAYTWPHRRIVQYVHTKYETPDWWSQTVTVGYERIKGLRAIGQRRGGGYKSMRVTWPDRTSVEIGFFGKGVAKSQVAVQHSRLPDHPTAVRLKQYWTERLGALGEVLASR